MNLHRALCQSERAGVRSDNKHHVTFRNALDAAPPPLQHTHGGVPTGMKAALGLNASQITSDLTTRTRWLP